MDEAWQQRVRERAYAIWQRQGNPDGAAEQFWLMAEEELLAEGQGPSRQLPEEQSDQAQDKAKIDNAINVPFSASDPPV